ncbi:MAG TPA: LysR substrate-binding domain-containing protein [bacterium]
MDTRKLTAFVAIAEELHFGRAAKRLHISQPPLSLLIRNLEAELGTRLFHRTSRKVELTAPGRVLLEEARTVLAGLERAARRTGEASRGTAGTLAIGFITPMIYAGLPDILRTFRARYPQVRLELREAMSDAQVTALEAGTLSLGFVAAPLANDALAHAVVRTEPLVAALAQRHRLAKPSRAIPLRQLASEPFILFPRPNAPGLFDAITGFCRSAGFSPRIDQEAVQSQTIVSLVAAGLGVAIVPESIRGLQRTGVVYRRFRERSPRVQTLAAWRHEDDSAALANFVAVVRELAGGAP